MVKLMNQSPDESNVDAQILAINSHHDENSNLLNVKIDAIDTQGQYRRLFWL